MPAKLKLLIVNSDLSQSELLSQTLSGIHVFDIIVTQSSREALNLLKNTAVNIIITNIDIGEIDGWRFSRMVRSGLLKTPKNTPIVLTPPTYCERIAETTARAYGIDAILPLEQIERLPQVLANALSTHIEKSSRLKLLLVEPNQETALDIERHLELSFAITHCENSKLALSLLQQDKFAIALVNASKHTLTDIQQFVSSIRKHHKSLAIVTLIDNQDADFAEQLLLMGITDFIRLPYNHLLLNKICDQAARRNDFMVSYGEFASKVEQLSQSEIRYRELFSAHQRILVHLNTAVVELDNQFNIRFLNPAWESLTGIGLQASLSRNITSFFEAEHLAILGEKLNQVRHTVGEKNHFELQIKHANGHSIWVECKLQVMQSAAQKNHFTLTLDNIEERKKAEFTLQHLALHDTLTNLHNRYFFDQQLQRVCSEVENSAHALIYIDLDHFKLINDSQGHQQGDDVLKQVANTFQSIVGQDALVCRLGGDEFAIIMEHTHILDAHMIAENLCYEIERSKFVFGENEYSISCSIGITAITPSNCDASECLKQADIALYVAKNRGRNLVHCYAKEDQQSKQLLSGMTWAHKVREALRNNQIEIHLQPIWSYQQNRIVYSEALVRLIVDGELLYPNQFLPSLDLLGDNNLLDIVVIEETISLLAKYPAIEKVAINLSAQALSNATLLETVSHLFEKYHVAPTRVCFEITESDSINNLKATKAMIESLKRLGCCFSIDDFGTGFSTFNYLKQLPADQVKIDGSFVKDMCHDPIDKALVIAIKDISHSLGKSCVAEYIEDKQTFDTLKKIGVDFAQGYFISRPLPVDAAIKKIEEINNEFSNHYKTPV